jgi:hypothetical protein
VGLNAANLDVNDVNDVDLDREELRLRSANGDRDERAALLPRRPHAGARPPLERLIDQGALSGYAGAAPARGSSGRD